MSIAKLAGSALGASSAHIQLIGALNKITTSKFLNNLFSLEKKNIDNVD